MTTTQSHLQPGLQVSGTDDIMEISSDYGLPIDEDEIDIDIDFVNDGNDEDLVIEDVDADIGYEEDNEGVNDDVMIEDDHSVVDMEDAAEDHNDIGDEYQQMEDAQIVDVAQLQQSQSAHGNLLNPNDLAVEETQDAGSEIGWDDPGDLVEMHNAEVQEPVQEAIQEPIQEGEVNAPDTEEGTGVDANEPTLESTLPLEPPEDSAETELHFSEHKQEDAVSEEHLSTVEETVTEAQSAKLGDQSASTVDSSAHTNEDVHEGDAEADAQLSATLTQEQETIDTSLSEVYVLYQGVEYALIGAADSTDPDSYFFRDDVAAKAGLDTFISGLRDILHNDIPDDHELILSIEDLGIDITENTAAHFGVTFAQLVQLHFDLRTNDDSANKEAMSVSLATRVNPLKRLNALFSGAAEGKGLSDFVAWESDSNDDEYEQPVGGSVNNDTSGDKDENEHDQHEQIDNQSANDATLSEAIAEEAVSKHTGDEDDVDHDDATQSTEQKQNEDEANPNLSTTEHQEESYNVEDDLIDYEEDGDEDPPSGSLKLDQTESSLARISSDDVLKNTEPGSLDAEYSAANSSKDENSGDVSLSASTAQPRDDNATSEHSSETVVNELSPEAELSGEVKQDQTALKSAMSKNRVDVSDDTDISTQAGIDDEIGYDDDIEEPALSAEQLDTRDLDKAVDEISYEDDDNDNTAEEPVDTIVDVSASSTSSPSSNGKRPHAELGDISSATEQQESKRLRS